MSEKDTVLVAAASYEDIADAEADYEAIKAHYYDLGTSQDFDAAVIARDENGEITVVKKHERRTRHGAVKGLGWGLAIGAACAIFTGRRAPRRTRSRRWRRRGDRRGHRAHEERHGRRGPQVAGARTRPGPSRTDRRLRAPHGRPDRGEHQVAQQGRIE